MINIEFGITFLSLPSCGKRKLQYWHLFCFVVTHLSDIIEKVNKIDNLNSQFEEIADTLSPLTRLPDPS